MAHVKGTPKTGGRKKGSKNKSTIAITSEVNGTSSTSPIHGAPRTWMNHNGLQVSLLSLLSMASGTRSADSLRTCA